MIYDKEIALKRGLNQAFLRSVPSKRDANVYTSDNPNAYIVKKISQR